MAACGLHDAQDKYQPATLNQKSGCSEAPGDEAEVLGWRWELELSSSAG